MKFFDLSIPYQEDNMSFSTYEKRLKCTYQEGDHRGDFEIQNIFDCFKPSEGTNLVFKACFSGAKNDIHSLNITHFQGKALIIDVSHKLNKIKNFFDHDGIFKQSLVDKHALLEYINTFSELELTKIEFEEALGKKPYLLKGIEGILFYTGLPNYYKFSKGDAWKHLYNHGISLSSDVVELIKKLRIKFVGVDQFDLSHISSYFSGEEKPFCMYDEVHSKLKDMHQYLKKYNFRYDLLQNNILIYQKLVIPSVLCSRKIYFYGFPLILGSSDTLSHSPVRAVAKMVS